MRTVISALSLAAFGLLASAAPADALTPAEQAAGWTILFDGDDTSAWRGYRSDGFPEQGWITEGGALRVTAGGGGGDIITREQFENFELTFDFKVAKGANSGVMFRVTEDGETPWRTGPEFQILDDAGYDIEPTAKTSVGGLYDLIAPVEGKVARPAGEWNSARIVIRDGRLRHWLNGVEVVDTMMDDAAWSALIAGSKFASMEGFGVHKRGHICLQDHGNDVWFRNVRIRDLDTPMPGELVLYDGSGLDAWTYHLNAPGTMDGTWSIDDEGVLICKGQPIGYIRTKQPFRSYVLQLDWRFNPVTKKSGNSGVLLRVVGEEKVWPRCVEAQLHGGSAGDFWNIGEFTMSTDADRTNGRNTKKLLGNENAVGEWNHYEIIVDGSSIKLHVNEELVNEAWDVEDIPGWIALQSEGAEIQFRDIRLGPIAPTAAAN